MNSLIRAIHHNALFAILLVATVVLLPSTLNAAPASKPQLFWAISDPNNNNVIDHSPWQQLLDHYLISDHPGGIHRFDYEKVTISDRNKLQGYLAALKNTDPRKYNRAEQKAYWINLYNALTIDLILKNYPVSSITKLGDSFLSFGPWDDKIAHIQGQPLSLNHIEHGILRPLFRDNRIHYAVNCASISCPNLSPHAFTAENTDELLTQGASEYINHPRGVTFEDDGLKVSSIYHWYKEDFGDNNQALINHLIEHAAPALAEQLREYQGDIDHHYNWALNAP